MFIQECQRAILCLTCLWLFIISLAAQESQPAQSAQTPQPVTQAEQSKPASSVEDELESFIKEAIENNPDICEARWKVEQALLRHQELFEYLDPAFTGTVGHSDSSKSVPGGSGYSTVSNNATEVNGGIEIPFEDGYYVTFGAAERRLHEPSGYEHLNQTLIGARVRIPLLRNRGFANLANDRALAMAEYNAAVSNLLSVVQRVRRDVTLAYIAAYESQASYRVTVEASDRFRKLVDEATELERLGVIPAYQIHDTRMDYQTGLENEEVARNRVELNLIALSALLGKHREIRLLRENDDEFLVNYAAETRPVTEVDMAKSLEHRGSYLAIENAIEQARIRIKMAQEELKDELNLNFGAAWQAENETHIIGDKELTGVERPGAEIAIVWKHTLGQRGPHARIARYNANVSQLNEQLRAQALSIETEVRNALNNFTTANTRLEIVAIGIEAAEKTLEAEQERFKLGQSTSGTVTDAQKDLTSLKQRLTSAAADLLRAWINLQYASGYTIK